MGVAEAATSHPKALDQMPELLLPFAGIRYFIFPSWHFRMPRTSPEQRAKVLAELKNKKAVSEIAKELGLTRSAIYRIVDGEKRKKYTQQPQPQQQQQQQQQPRQPQQPQQQEPDSDSDESDVSSLDSRAFFHSNDKFADDLGLPQDSGKVNHTADENQGQITQEMEDELDEVLDKITGNAAVSTIPFPFQKPGQDISSLIDIIGAPIGGAYEEEELPQRQRRATTVEPIRYNREDLIQRIVFNVQHFGSLLETITGSNKEAFIASLADKEGFELKHLLTTLERTRSVGTISAGFKQVFYIAAQGVEITSGFVGVKSQGFTAQLHQQDEEITMCMKEIALNEWERLKDLDSPQTRLAMLFCLTLAQTHTKNEIITSQSINAPINPELSKATEDL